MIDQINSRSLSGGLEVAVPFDLTNWSYWSHIASTYAGSSDAPYTKGAETQSIVHELGIASDGSGFA